MAIKYKGYKEYVAILSQTGTNAPTATVIYNSLGGTLTLGYNSVGLYTATLTGAFPSGSVQTFCNFASGFPSNPERYMTIYRYSNDEIRIKTWDTGTLTNAMLNGACVYIRVYDTSYKVYRRYNGRKMYSAIATQTSTNAPTLTVLSNSFNFTPNFAYDGLGEYSDAAFGEAVDSSVATLRFRNIPHATDTGFYYFIYDKGAGTDIGIESGATGVKANDKLTSSPIHIEKFALSLNRRYDGRKRFVAYLVGNNGANPTVTTLLNEFNLTPTITRDAEGDILISMASAVWTVNKTTAFCWQGDRRSVTPKVVTVSVPSTTACHVYSYDTGVADDLALEGAFLEICTYD